MSTSMGTPLLLARIRLHTDHGLYIASGEGYGASHALNEARDVLERQIRDRKTYGERNNPHGVDSRTSSLGPTDGGSLSCARLSYTNPGGDSPCRSGMEPVEGSDHQPSVHCGATALRNVTTYYGMTPIEAACFEIGVGPAFVLYGSLRALS